MTADFRIQLDLPPNSAARLQHIVDTTEASSPVEVIRNALRLYEAVLQEAQAGGRFLIQRANSDEPEPYEIFADK